MYLVSLLNYLLCSTFGYVQDCLHFQKNNEAKLCSSLISKSSRSSTDSSNSVSSCKESTPSTSISSSDYSMFEIIWFLNWVVALPLCSLLLCALNVEYTLVWNWQPLYGHRTLCLHFKCLRKCLKNSASVQGSMYSHDWQWNATLGLLACPSDWECQTDKCTFSALKDLKVHKQSS